MRKRRKGLIHRHSLSVVSIGVLIMWIFLYSVSSPSTHTGSFFGNAIADWPGVVVVVIATKYLYEKGSSESRRPPHDLLSPIRERLRDHSLSIFLLITGIGWIALYVSMDSETKWGQVVGNIVSEWMQIFGLVLMTKSLIEPTLKRECALKVAQRLGIAVRLKRVAQLVVRRNPRLADYTPDSIGKHCGVSQD
jgi:hypothetical protein